MGELNPNCLLSTEGLGFLKNKFTRWRLHFGDLKKGIKGIYLLNLVGGVFGGRRENHCIEKLLICMAGFLSWFWVSYVLNGDKLGRGEMVNTNI